MRSASVQIPVLLLSLLLTGRAWAAEDFVDVTKTAGIDFRHTFGDAELSNIVESVGSGASFLDFDGDGHLDLYVVNGRHLDGVTEGKAVPGSGPNRLYRNRGDGTFEDFTDRSGAGDDGYGVMAAVGDYDNDGRPDLYVVNYGQNRLYHNEGGRFRDVTQAAGVGDTHYGLTATFFDLDNDGDLDLYVGNYLEYDPSYRHFYSPDRFPGPLAYKGQPDVLYRNDGKGHFTNITATAGVGNPDGRAMSLSAADFDEDGHVDLFVANDAMENYLYRNEGGGKLGNAALPTGVAFGENGEATSAMATCWGELDGDGHQDLFVSDTAYSSLFRGLGGGRFEDRTGPSGVAELTGQYVSWGAELLDYDNDGDLDIFVANGALHFLFGKENLLLENDGHAHFTDVSRAHGACFDAKRVGRGVAIGDYDSDGDMDVFISNLGGAAVLLRNDLGNKRAWISLRLVGTRSNRDGFGAKVSVTAGGRTQIREHRGTAGYLGQNDPRLHFGLGDAKRVERVEVRWPSGARQVLKDLPIRQFVTVKEPAK